MPKKEVGVLGEKEGDVQKKSRDLCEAEWVTFSEQSENHDIYVCPDGVELAASSSVKRDKAEYGNEELLEMAVVNAKPARALNSTGILDLKDHTAGIQPCLLRYHSIPLNLVREGQRCPSRKRVSPVHGFPAGRGRKVPRLSESQEKPLGQRETVSNIHKRVLLNGVNQRGEEPNADTAGKDKELEVLISGKNRDVLENSVESHKGVKKIMQAPLLSKSSDVKQEEKFEGNNEEKQGKIMKQSENNGKESTSFVKDINNKKKSTGYSSSNMKWLEKGNCSPYKRDNRRKVRDTLRLFHTVLRKLVQANETKKMGRVDASIQINAALQIFKDHGKYVNTKKKVGPVPGVEVGDLFKYRVELAIIGLHKPLQSGIDFVKLDDEYVAISVVASGRYDNDVGNSDVLIYVGQGGNVAGGCKYLEDQKLERGNLALKNSIDKKNPVRVIRGFKERKMSGGKRTTTPSYTYDGLYTVKKYWRDTGPQGKLIYKFELRRAPNQPELIRKRVKQSNKSKKWEGSCINDISKGKEPTPICAVNTIDNEKPPPFTYITAVMYPDWCRPIPPKGCDCKDSCADSKHCACSLKNGGKIPYNYSGAIVEEKSLAYECGPSCNCPPTCHNRVSQHGIKLPLEIFKTESKGWGLRSLSSIPSGSFVCEYIGELLDDKEAEQRVGNDEYLFDIGQNYSDPTLREELSALMPDKPSSCRDVVENVGFTLDAGIYGNVGRFINHSCSPNLFAQNVLYDHDDKRIPHIMMFACENIPPLQELTYHYNYAIDQVFDFEGKIKKKSCHCGSSECSGRMY
ncbi:histone-lysine N-methyltransferase, H3 lysine-9 specific SUVH6 [Beta vulgaris subsp. vulgaris]|uniref:histone-lysine N-methyltransferase, H3 lysine-9 specific SUVH6 n=1 Tax=Beta vulgaris subsp. vulgaris TaxID=3555 RepID=UPI0020373E66|nr:histone-lysine N-methyltransferase, H3 lysine-9 specific SUVH6 [Beta vulgaris subsp. vulgaris]XP_048500860.1 histone-lysine N-methyltransferase, H3 lysine-9 specific SUVH6 [Beta vulgaris subsp. vulgaris]XP_048500861.1 histone-lysine N-methyltransferase, H3 lysine-9 specific SUVH6 [Beta vulgaris subsp. vulgaris]